MRYCCSYKAKPEIRDQADEIRYSSLTDIFEIRESYANKRIIYEILNMEDIKVNSKSLTAETMVKILDEMPNLYIDFYSYQDMLHFFEVTEGSHNHRCMHHYPVDGYNMLNLLLSFNVSDITITEPLVFDIEKVSHFIKYDNPDCKIRFRPYIGREAWAPMNDDLCHFWVLPQHLYLYEDYVDVIDILADTVIREETLFEIYKRGIYGLDMSALIEHFDVDPPMKAIWIDDSTALHRTKCRQICQSTKPVRCHVCQLQHRLLQQMPHATYEITHSSQLES